MSSLEYALHLRSMGYIGVPLLRGKNLLDVAAMGFPAVHLQTLRRDLRRLVFSSVTFSVSQRPPDAVTVERWFEGHDGNIGIVGGVADLLILDFDSGQMFERWRRRNRDLAGSTPIEKTPRGYHVYLSCAVPCVSASLYLGIRRAGDVKGLGGYVACSPSTLRDGSTYRWLAGQSLLELEPRRIERLQDISLQPKSPLKRHYDRLRGGGFFDAQ